MVESLSRRRVLATVVSGGLSIAAGCSGGTGGGPTSSTATTSTGTATPAPTPVSDATVEASAGDALVDDATGLRVTGLPPDTEVTLRATAPGDAGDTWAATATYRSDAAGVVDWNATEPVDGWFNGRNGVGLLQALAPPSGEPTSHSLEWDDGYEIDVTASVDGTEVGATTLTRRYDDRAVTVAELDHDELVAFHVTPAGEGPHPAVLALHGSGGRPLVTRARLLASHGYATLALQYFRGDGLPYQLSEVPLSYFETAVEWLRARSDTGDDVALYGRSKGAELALLLAPRLDAVRSVVATAPGAYVMFSLTGDDTSSWAVDGEPVPFLDPPDDDSLTTVGEHGGVAYRDYYAAAIDRASEAEREAARLPVEEFDGPVLLVSGEDDQVWPATRMGETLAAAAADSDRDAPFEHRHHPDAGHVFAPPYTPTVNDQYARLAFGGTSRGIARAQVDAWPRILSFLE